MKTTFGRAEQGAKKMTTLTYDDGATPCEHCGHEPQMRTCDGCGETGRIIDCGHYAQPRPLAASAVHSGATSCETCEEDWRHEEICGEGGESQGEGDPDDEAISRLLEEAGEAGDLAQVAICEAAISGDGAARAECDRVIRAGVR